MESYRIMSDSFIKRGSDLALIPPNPSNPDYVQYLADVALGATVMPFDYDAEALRQETLALIRANELLGIENFKAMVRRRAEELQTQGLPVDALIILKTIGE